MIRTERLVLRRWRAADAEPFAALNAHPEVARFVGGPMTREASDAMIARFTAFHAQRGWGRFAVEWQGECVGFVGLGLHPFVGNDVEIGWRLAWHAWGHGIATEAARAVVAAAPGWGVGRLVSVVHPDNLASQAVCGRLGMELAEERDGLRVYALTSSRSEPS